MRGKIEPKNAFGLAASSLDLTLILLEKGQLSTLDLWALIIEHQAATLLPLQAHACLLQMSMENDGQQVQLLQKRNCTITSVHIPVSRWTAAFCTICSFLVVFKGRPK